MKSIRASRSRTHLLAALLLVMMAIFVVRLFYLQVIQHNFYVTQANSEQLKQFEITPKRGEIYAMNGDTPSKLVLNEAVYTVWADPKTVDNPEAVIEAVRSAAGGSARKNLAMLIAQKQSRYQVLATKVTRSQAEMIKARRLRGVGFDQGTRRVYPEGTLASQVLGFVDNEGVGKYGIESALDDRLKGQKGLLQTVTDVRDVPLTVGNSNVKHPARDGDNIVLTIDRTIQAQAEKILATGLRRVNATDGSVVVMDPQTGKIQAMANLPTYDPANLASVSNVADFNNPVIDAPYEPGSVIKTLTIASALDQGTISPGSTYNNTDYIKIGDRTITNASKGQTGTISMQTALNWSLNTGMVTILQRMGGGAITKEARQTLYDYFYNKYHLGQRTGIELAGEARGIIVSPDEAEGNAVRYSNMTFGQGLDITMLQTASAFSAVINGGTYYMPTVIAGTMSQAGRFERAAPKPSTARVISPEASATARRMIHDARQFLQHNGDIPGYYIGGKTGTSEAIVGGRYTLSETIASYLGFGGETADEPRYVIMVRVAGKGLSLEGGKAATPIFTELSNWMCNYLKLQPSGV